MNLHESEQQQQEDTQRHTSLSLVQGREVGREAEALLLAGSDRARAAELLGDAARLAEALGARPLAGAVQALARRARIPIGTTTDGAPDPPPAGLTPRELEVLRLMAEGHTNREIGSVLFISEKTVSVHVSRVLAKLGAANRHDACAIARRMGWI